MKKPRVAIVGYGNLGKAVESALYYGKYFRLVKIFSNRTGLVSPFGTTFEKTSNLKKYAGKVDILFLCGGSFNDIQNLAPQAIKMFNTVDSFDTHAKLVSYISSLDKLAKNSGKVAVCAGGWDPGLMSIMRLIFNSISPLHAPANSFWGKGVSQGHSNAIRKINGVKDAIQYTIPNKKIVKRCFGKFDQVPSSTQKHKRLCYVVLKEDACASKVKSQIINMPNYFLGYKTVVKFVSDNKLKRMKNKMFHKGCVVKNFRCDSKYATKLTFALKTQSNPYFTAEILVALACAVSKLSSEQKFGAYSVFDLPLSYLTMQDRQTLLKTLL